MLRWYLSHHDDIYQSKKKKKHVYKTVILICMKHTNRKKLGIKTWEEKGRVWEEDERE